MIQGKLLQMQFNYTILNYKKSVRFIFNKSQSLTNKGCILHTELSHWRWLLKPTRNKKVINLFVEKLKGYERFDHRIPTTFSVYTYEGVVSEEQLKNDTSTLPDKTILFSASIALWSRGNSYTYNNINLPTNGEIWVAITEYLIQRQTFYHHTLMESTLIHPECKTSKLNKSSSTVMTHNTTDLKCEPIQKQTSSSAFTSLSPLCRVQTDRPRSIFGDKLKTLNFPTKSKDSITVPTPSNYTFNTAPYTACPRVDLIKKNEYACSKVTLHQQINRFRNAVKPPYMPEIKLKTEAEGIVNVLQLDLADLSVLVLTPLNSQMTQVAEMENRLNTLVARIKRLIVKSGDLPQPPIGPVTVQFNLKPLSDTLAQMSSSVPFLDQYRGDAATLAAFLAYLNEVHSERRGDYQNVFGQRQNLRLALDALNRNIEQRTQEIEKLSVQYRDAVIKLEANRGDVGTQRKEIDREVEHLQEMQERLIAVEGENKHFERLAGSFETEPLVSIKHFRANQEYKSLSEKIRVARHRVDSIRATLQRTQQQAHQQEVMVSQLNEALERVKEDHNSFANQSNTLTTKLGDLDAVLQQYEYDFKVFDRVMTNTQHLLVLYEEYERMLNEYNFLLNTYQTNYSELSTISLPSTAENSIAYDTFKTNIDARNEQVVMITSQLAHYRSEYATLIDTRTILNKKLTQFDESYQALNTMVNSLTEERKIIEQYYQQVQCHIAQVTRMNSLPRERNGNQAMSEPKDVGYLSMEVYNLSNILSQYFKEHAVYVKELEALVREDCRLYQDYFRYRARYDSLSSTRGTLEAKITEANTLYTHIESNFPTMMTRYSELVCSYETIEKQLETLLCNIKEEIHNMNLLNQQLSVHILKIGNTIPLTRDIVALKLKQLEGGITQEPINITVPQVYRDSPQEPHSTCEMNTVDNLPVSMEVGEDPSNENYMDEGGLDLSMYKKPETGYM